MVTEAKEEMITDVVAAVREIQEVLGIREIRETDNLLEEDAKESKTDDQVNIQQTLRKKMIA